MSDELVEEVWRKEFESIFPDPSPRFEKTGHYVNSHRESMWAGFEIAKRNQPVVELPSQDDYYDRFGFDMALQNALTAAGIEYKVKS